MTNQPQTPQQFAKTEYPGYVVVRVFTTPGQPTATAHWTKEEAPAQIARLKREGYNAHVLLPMAQGAIDHWARIQEDR